MHSEILNDRQRELLPLMAQFRREYYLVGGTAIALYLGHRSKWKDYVDLYFLLRDHFTLADICAEATCIFGELFSEKMFRSQLCYFKDIDYTEAVDWLMANPPTDEEIKQRLTEIAVQDIEGL